MAPPERCWDSGIIALFWWIDAEQNPRLMSSPAIVVDPGSHASYALTLIRRWINHSPVVNLVESAAVYGIVSFRAAEEIGWGNKG